jgi:hypothetical protein
MKSTIINLLTIISILIPVGAHAEGTEHTTIENRKVPLSRVVVSVSPCFPLPDVGTLPIYAFNVTYAVQNKVYLVEAVNEPTWYGGFYVISECRERSLRGPFPAVSTGSGSTI